MKRCILFVLCPALIAGFFATPANAWHARGHMTVALIAYRQLEEPQKKVLRDILKDHPHFKEFLSQKKPWDATMEEWMVMQAAIWPDWVRTHHADEYSKPTHHYVNLPIRRLNGATEAQKEKIEANIATPPDPKEVGVILDELPKRLDEVRKAKDPIALCWVLHQIGDIHQPLHAAALFTKKSLAGDRGGNAAFVRWNGRPENLHAIWDGVVGWDEFGCADSAKLSEFGVVDFMTRKFQHDYPVTDDQRKVTDVGAWAKESLALAEKEVYSSNNEPLKIVFNFEKHPHLTAADVHPLPEGYQGRAQSIAERRVALAGTRLADQLKDILR